MTVTDFKNDKGLWVRSFRTDGQQVYTRAGKRYDGMFSRCRKGGSTQASQPRYIGCTVSENFKDFQFFAEWCQSQVGYLSDGYALDKDLLMKGNKEYSEDVCVFLPQEVNNLILKSDAVRGEYPIGVSLDKRRNAIIATCRLGVGRKSKYLGTFGSPEQAFEAYKQFKEDLIKQRANEYKSFIDCRAYDALMSYEILITD